MKFKQPLFFVIAILPSLCFSMEVSSIKSMPDIHGAVATLVDGAVTCRIFDNLKYGVTAGSVVVRGAASSIDCKYENNEYRPDGKPALIDIKWDDSHTGHIRREEISKRVCYIYTRKIETAGISCP